MGRFLLSDPNLTPNQRAAIARQNKPKEHWLPWIGRKVTKASTAGALPKKFKSGKRINTIKGVVVHQQMTAHCDYTVWAFTFEEDESYVACHSVEEFDSMSEKTSAWIKTELKTLYETASKSF